MFRFVLSLICACAFLVMTLAAPVPPAGLGKLAKRTTYTGTTTFFYVGEGACGEWNNNSDHIVALGPGHYQGGDHCGQYIHVENLATHEWVYAMVRDECVSCADSNRIDLSPSAFSAIGSEATGVLPVQWHFMAKGFEP